MNRVALLQRFGSKRPVKDSTSCRPDSLGFPLLAYERAKPVLTKGQQLRGRKVLSEKVKSADQVRHSFFDHAGMGKKRIRMPIVSEKKKREPPLSPQYPTTTSLVSATTSSSSRVPSDSVVQTYSVCSGRSVRDHRRIRENIECAHVPTAGSKTSNPFLSSIVVAIPLVEVRRSPYKSINCVNKVNKAMSIGGEESNQLSLWVALLIERKDPGG